MNKDKRLLFKNKIKIIINLGPVLQNNVKLVYLKCSVYVL